MTADPLDAIMRVMDEAFDPAFGEAWTRRQIGDALTRPNTFCLLAPAEGPPHPFGSTHNDIHGFSLTRVAADEEELLLLAVRPGWRGRGIGTRLLINICETAKARGTARMFLEMRDGNKAISLYQKFGFSQVGRRPAYYRSGANGPIDALTFALDL